MERLHCEKRFNKTNHDGKKERKAGKIPGIIYGKHIENLLFEIGELELNRNINEHGGHGVIDLELDGENHKAVIKEIQRDPVTRKALHIDLEELSEDSIVQTEVPIVFAGEELVMRKGGILQKEKNSVKVQCKGNKIPKCINVDLSSLKKGDVYRVSDIEISQEIAFVDDLNSIIVSVTENNMENFKDDEDEEIV